VIILRLKHRNGNEQDHFETRNPLLHWTKSDAAKYSFSDVPILKAARTSYF